MSERPTVAAISTASSAGGIGIVRISGKEALEVAERCFLPSKRLLLSQSEGYRAYHGMVIQNGEAVDEAICLVFRAPHSYTGEDVAEISCHGGLFITQKVLAAVLQAGAAPASAGEFTKRAFLNGKIDLTGAEAVMQLISAQGEQAAKAALTTLDGALHKKISNSVQKLISVCAHISAWVDYPDEEIEDIDNKNLTVTFEEVVAELKKLLKSFDNGRAVIEGVDTVIVGRPNVGKSTLMNLLSGFDRSIVTPVPGTTRDVVEETVRLENIVLRVADTAGIRSTEDLVEGIGVDLAKKRLERAELVLAVFDSSDELTAEDIEILNSCSGKRMIAVINKTDLNTMADIEHIKAVSSDYVEISAALGVGYEELCKKVTKVLGAEDFDPSSARLMNERQRNCCLRALEHVEEALHSLKSGVTLDAVGVCADLAIDELLEITGTRATQAVVDEVFAQFCVGK